MRTKRKSDTIRCAIYTRKSTVKGLEQQYNSLDAQEDRCKSFIELHDSDGWVHVETFSDAGISGGTSQRPALTRMMEAARRKKFDMVIVFKLDRLARNQRDFLNMLDTLDKHGVEVASATEPFDSGSYLGRGMRNLLGVFAEMEREMIAERTREKAEACRRKGLYLFGKPPFGYTRVEGKLHVVPEQASTIKRMFDEYAQGRSCMDIADILNKENLLRINRTGETAKWTHKEVNRALRNPLYTGYIPSGDERYEAQHKRIVPRDLWERVQERMDKLGSEMKERTKPRRSKEVYPLAGLLICATCGKKMRGSYARTDDQTYRYYSCATRKIMGTDGCECPHVNADEIEAFVRTQLNTLRNNPDFIAALISRLPQIPGGKISDCVFNMDRLLEYGSPTELKTIFHKVFTAISFDWKNEKLDFKYQSLT